MEEVNALIASHESDRQLGLLCHMSRKVDDTGERQTYHNDQAMRSLLDPDREQVTPLGLNVTLSSLEYYDKDRSGLCQISTCYVLVIDVMQLSWINRARESEGGSSWFAMYQLCTGIGSR